MTSRLLQHWLTRQAERRPHERALVMRNEAWSYGRLEAVSNRLARILREAGCRRGARVALLAPKSPEAVASMLGVYKADAIAVPLDPSSPAARLRKILRSCESRFVLASGAVSKTIDELRISDAALRDMHVGWISENGSGGEDPRATFVLEDLASYPVDPPECANDSGDPAHILYTSGSTGEPKGVVVTHSSVLHFVDWAVEHFSIGADDRLSGHSPLHFDLSTFDVFGALAAGAELHLVPPELNLLPHKLAAFIREGGLTQWFSVPSILNYLARFDVVRRDDFPELKRLLWCGEVFPTPALIYWMQRLPHARFCNLYGPTEATIASSYHDVLAPPTDERAPLPIGRPCEGEELLVLDEELRPAPAEEVGELYIRGVGLSPGYWNDPERTDQSFLPNPQGPPGDRIYRTGDRARLGADGLVYLLGRVDSQIKSRGYRIELGEIESAVHALGRSKEAVVSAVATDGFEGSTICCAYVPVEGRDVSAAKMREELSRLLPGYMIPTRWMSVKRLPRNSNGKIDRRIVNEQFEHDEIATPR